MATKSIKLKSIKRQININIHGAFTLNLITPVLSPLTSHQHKISILQNIKVGYDSPP